MSVYAMNFIRKILIKGGNLHIKTKKTKATIDIEFYGEPQLQEKRLKTGNHNPIRKEAHFYVLEVSNRI